jgi:cytoskeleton protein RodZ
MPEIGATLREARMRRKVDIVEVEAETKIRARYIRALEEEEFDLLPGPTYVKSFLRTYGEYLGLDAKLLVEEYKQRYERPTPQELTPFSTNLGSRRERRRARGPLISPGVIVAVCIVALIGALAAIGLLWGDDQSPPAATTAPTATSTTSERTTAAARRARARRDRQAARERRRRSRPSTVRVQIVPEGTVYVCLESSRGTPLIDKATLTAGNPSRRFTGRRFRVTFGNGAVRMRVAGKSYAVPQTDVPLGYDIRPGRAPRRLPASQLPTCA